ncbi:MAG: hypothetical protein PWP24_436 [Clostridiales bacterium]|nr:hypothetical protein [Clostridiales bacterium]
MNGTYENLFSKGKIGNLTLKNRIVMPAMGTAFAASTGEASDEMIRYYEERAKGGCGLIITEITRIDDETGIGTSNQLSVTDAKFIPRLTRLADAIHRHDSKVFVQLQHPGRQTPSRLLHGKQIVAPSPIVCSTIGEMPRELTTDECDEMVKKFVKGAYIAKAAGIDGVEIHAAHGYLINQFLSPTTNKRTDKYGGNFVKRLRFLDDIILGIRYACGADYPISVRISADEFVEGGLKLEDTVKIARHLESIGVHAINVSCGTYESGYSIIEPYQFEEGWKKHLAKTIRENVKIPVIAVNNIKHPSVAESLLEEGVCDFIGIARGHLVDPEWGNKAKYTDEAQLRKCIGCLYCFKIANTGRALACTANPILGRETLFNQDTLKKNGAGKTVAVIGGGPGGMQAAKVLAEREYKVVLFEKNDALGGTLNVGDKPPHKHMITELVETQKAEIEALGVEVRLGHAPTPEEVKTLNPYGVIMACGGTPIRPNVPGIDGANVVRAEDVLVGKVKLSGQKIAVIGGGVTGLETAEVLGSDNDVTVVEMADSVGTALYPSVRGTLLKRLEALDTHYLTNHALAAIGKDQISMTVMPAAITTTLAVDTVVIAIGVKPQTELIEAFEAVFDKITSVGDAHKPGLIGDAMKEANDKAFVF